jgi:phospholipase/lecithinase/hemolysin
MRNESFSFLSSAKTLLGKSQLRAGRFRSRTWLSLATLAVFSVAAALAQVKDYTTIVVFGDSLSDTGNVAHLTQAKYGFPFPIPGPGPGGNYTVGRFTDGFDTIPPAQKYFGVWIEQFAASLPSHPEVTDSLGGGTNYAYGFASTGSGTSLLTFGPSNSLSVQVENIGQQITDYLATHPKIDNRTLFVIWGGAIDVLYATSLKDVVNGAANQVLNIQRLIQAGATQFLVPNLPPLGLVPRFNSSPAAALPVTVASLVFNGYLATGIAVLKDFYPRRKLTIYQLDTFRLLGSIVAAPAAYSLTDVTHSAQGLAVDPDTYLFWDDLHPTTRGHNILSDSAITLVNH